MAKSKKSTRLPINKATGLFLLVGVVAVAGLEIGIARPANKLREDTKKEVKVLNQEVTLLKARNTLLTSGREDPLLAIQQRASTLQEYLPEEVDITLFATILPQLAQNRNIILTFNVNENKESSQVPGANYVPLSINATGSFDALAAFVDDLGKIDKIATLFNPKIEKEKTANVNGLATEANFTLTAELRAWFSITSILPPAPAPVKPISPTPNSTENSTDSAGNPVQNPTEIVPTQPNTQPNNPTQTNPNQGSNQAPDGTTEADLNEAYAVIKQASSKALLDSGRTQLIESDFANLDMDNQTPGVQLAAGAGPWRFVSKTGKAFQIDPDRGRLSPE